MLLRASTHKNSYTCVILVGAHNRALLGVSELVHRAKMLLVFSWRRLGHFRISPFTLEVLLDY